jgi:23S rRNA (adenine1618-N6)-methyltransferase
MHPRKPLGSSTPVVTPVVTKAVTKTAAAKSVVPGEVKKPLLKPRTAEAVTNSAQAEVTRADAKPLAKALMRAKATSQRPASNNVVKPGRPDKKSAVSAATDVADVTDAKAGLHPRNRHPGQYDFAALVAASPALGRFVTTNRFGNRSIDFAKPAAVKALNQAILLTQYDIRQWEVPPQYLCPPIPGRADYIHHLADLLATANGGTIPRGPMICAFDVGVGASAIYPLIGYREYGWRFVGSESDPAAMTSAQRIVRANPGLDKFITLRRQKVPLQLFAGVVKEDEHFDVAMSNPPFHASAAEAMKGTRRKWNNLGKPEAAGRGAPLLNFGGQESELWCEGGEVGFISRMISESTQVPGLCLWFTSLVSKEASLPLIVRVLQAAHVRERRVIEMTHGQKRTRIIAWTFMDERQRRDWRGARWTAQTAAGGGL